MTPQDTESDQIRLSTLRAYELAKSAGLNPGEVKQFYRPVEGSKRIATGGIELAPSNFEAVQILINEYLTKGFKVSYSPFFDGSNNMSVSDYIKRAERIFRGRPKLITITLKDTGSMEIPGLIKDKFVSKENLELRITERKVPAQSQISEKIDRLIKV